MTALCENFLFAVTILIQISWKNVHLAQKCYFYQRATKSKVERFLKSNFSSKLNMQTSAYT